MAVAMIYPEAEKGGRGKTNSLKIKEFTSGYVSQARTVLHWIPAIAAKRGGTPATAQTVTVHGG